MNVFRLLAGFLGWIAAASAWGQAWPQKPVRVVVGNAPGSLSDVVSRQVFQGASQVLGQALVIDHRAGAGGVLAAETVAKSAPDGYTLLWATDGMMAINPFVYPNLPYDPLRDFAPVSLIAKIPYVLLANPSLGARSVEELVAAAKARPGQISYSSGGNGHATHLEMELFARKAGIRLVHVPYKGTTPALQAVVSGEVGANMIGLGIALPHIASGKLVALAIGGPREKDVLPRVPSLAAAVPGTEYVSWMGMFAPAGTPKTVIDRVHSAIAKAMEAPELKSKLAGLGMAAIGSAPNELAQEVRSSLEVTRELVKALGLKLD